MSNQLKPAVKAIKSGDKETGRVLLEETLQSDPQNEIALLWMSQVVDTDEDRITYLKRVLDVNPNNSPAKLGLAHLEASQPKVTTLPKQPPSPILPKSEPPAPEPAKLDLPSTTPKIGTSQPVEAAPDTNGSTRSPVETLVIEPAKTQQVDTPLPVSVIQPLPDSEDAEEELPTSDEETQTPPPTTDTSEAELSQSDDTVTQSQVLTEIIETDTPPEIPPNTDLTDAFISYSRRDKTFVQTLYERLLAEDRNIWIDWGNIPLTADWRQEIKEGIERAGAVIFVISPDFLASKECGIELDWAVEMNKRLIPVVHRDVDPNDVPHSLASLNWIFARKEDDFETAFQSLQESLDTDLDWVKGHTRLLVRATEWDQNNRNNSFLLHGDDLSDAEIRSVQGNKQPEFLPLQREYIMTSRQYATKKQRGFLIRVTAAFVVSIILAIVAFFAYRDAQQQRKIAEAERDLAQSRQLLANAQNNLDIDPEISILLALQALDKVDTQMGQTVLQQAMQSSFVEKTFTGHTNTVKDVVFSPDGTQAATASKDTTAKVWDVETGQELLTLTGHTNSLTSIAFNPDGTQIATGSLDTFAKIWDAKTGKELHSLAHPNEPIMSVDFSPDGSRLATGTENGTVKIWNTETGDELLTIPTYSESVYRVAFSPDGSRLSSGGEDNLVKVWDVETGDELLTLSGHKNIILGIDFSPDGTQIATASGDRLVKLWDANTGKELNTFFGHDDWVEDVVYSPDGTRLATASDDRTAKLWDITTGETLLTYLGHTNLIQGVDFSPDGKHVITTGNDSTTKMWRTTTPDILTGHSDWVNGVAFSPDNSQIVSASDDYTVKIWDTATGETIKTLFGHTLWVEDATFSKDGKQVVSSSSNGEVFIWDVETGKKTFSLTDANADPTGAEFAVPVSHTDEVNDVDYIIDGDTKLIATASSDNTAKLWDADAGELVLTLIGHTDGVENVAFNSTTRYLATASEDNTAKLWDIDTGQEIRTFTGHTGGLNSLVFNPDGTRLVTASDDNTIKIWDVNTGEVLYTLHGHENHVVEVEYSPDGKLLASSGEDEIAKIWDAETGKELMTLQGHTSAIQDVSFSKDGQYLATASQDRTARVFLLNRDKLIEQAYSRLSRWWDSEECREYLGSEEACPPPPNP